MTVYYFVVKSNMASCMTLVQRHGPLLWWTFSISNAKSQQKMSSNRQNIVPYKEIGVKELNSGVKMFTGNS